MILIVTRVTLDLLDHEVHPENWSVYDHVMVCIYGNNKYFTRLDKDHMDQSDHPVKMESLELLVSMVVLDTLDHEDLKVILD